MKESPTPCGPPPVCGDIFCGLCDHAFWHNAAPRENPGFRHGQVVFCKIDEVWRLFRALRRTRRRIVLVTGEGDKPVTPELYSQKPPHVSHWFGMNMFAVAPDVTPIPLGLGAEGHPATLDWREIQEAISSSPPRTKLLYANFGAASNPSVREPLATWVRRPSQNWMTVEDHSQQSGRASYLQNLLSHHFVFCPPGNGEDTHRMWEALYCGAIPVVRESPVMRDFSDLPILFVPRLDEISENFLQDVLARWPKHEFSSAKLDVGYWRDRFTEAQTMASHRGSVTAAEWMHAWVGEAWRLVREKAVGR